MNDDDDITIFRLDNELYAVIDQEIFRLDLEDITEDEITLKKIQDFKNDFKNMNSEILDLQKSLKETAKKHGIEIKEKTRKDYVQEWREKKKSEKLNEDKPSNDKYNVDIVEELDDERNNNDFYIHQKTSKQTFIVRTKQNIVYLVRGYYSS